MNKRPLLALTAATLMAAAPALAQVNATAATDLNLRAGPAGDQQVLSVIPAQGEVTVTGCLETGNWCQVDFQGTQGWAYGEYLNAMMEEQPVVVIENREPLQIATITRDDVAEETTVGDVAGAAGVTLSAGAGGAIASALIGGPAAIAAGALLGAAAAGSGIEAATTYAQENPADPMVMEGEIIVGAGIPEGVEIIEIPETEYGYLNVNGQPVIIDQQNRQIVRIVR